MTEETRAAARFLFETTLESQDEIGRRTGYSQSSISKFAQQERWRRPKPAAEPPIGAASGPDDPGAADGRRRTFTANLWRAAEHRLGAGEVSGRELVNLAQAAKHLADLDEPRASEREGNDRTGGRSSEELEAARKSLAEKLERIVASHRAEEERQRLLQSRDGGFI